MKNKISAKIVADSFNKQGNRITTMEVVFPRMILAEFNTHRLFSRNSASSRAIPFKKMLELVETEPFIPIAWQKDHSGMQGSEYIENEHLIKEASRIWLKARTDATTYATILNNSVGGNGVTKQLCNRLLEPFMYHKVLVTFTESENFFNLRCPKYQGNGGETFKSKRDAYMFTCGGEDSEFFDRMFPNGKPLPDLEWLKINKGAGEIHIMDLAEKMRDAMDKSTPKILKEGEWHVPYGDDIDYYKLGEVTSQYYKDNPTEIVDIQKWVNKISVARCARLSYQTLGDNPKIDYEADIKLFDILFSSGHLSPFEHLGRAMTDDEYNNLYKGDKELGNGHGWSNNFRGFVQYRQVLES